MTDYLKNFAPGEDIKASETNNNNQFLLDKISDNAENIQKYVNEQLGTIQSNLSSVQKTLQQNIDQLSEELTVLQNGKFTQKNAAIGIGQNNLKAYLPDDDKEYLVWVNAAVFQQSGNACYISTDIMTTGRVLLQLDADAGRSSADCTLCTVPVGAGRTITLSGTVSWANLCGYCKL